MSDISLPWLHVMFYTGASAVFAIWKFTIEDDGDVTGAHGFELMQAVSADLRDTALLLRPADGEPH